MKKRVFCLLCAVALLCGCDEASRYNDERTGTSIDVIDAITIGATARSQIKISLGENQSGYVSVSIGGYQILYNDYLTKEQVDKFDKRLVCDATLLGDASAWFRCGWTQYDPMTGRWRGVLGGDWSAASHSRLIYLDNALNIDVLVGDRREGFFTLYFTSEGYLF
ncbi:MAG: hypothetical protein LBO72_04125 [Helicobacteraceae bacterium]|jgi:hypothetical protein|nr:hypothetical protein [Helicobacteraceae bacterium]